jgi:short subunit dehydrogenase-like uncharacterized protein
MDRIDIVIFGATGYSGQYLVKEMATIFQDEMISWAVAGRSKQKLNDLLESISKEISKLLF